MNKEQVKELAEINATYIFDKVAKQYGEFTDEYVRHFYNKLAELRGGIDLKTVLGYIDTYFEIVKSDKQSNADRIRNMSDEELAEFLDIVGEDGISSQYADVPCDCCCEKTECSKCWKDWLQSEAE